MSLEVEVEIARPQEEVFRYLADAENLPRWLSDFAGVEKISDGPIQKGTEFKYRLKRPAKESTFAWSEFEPNRRLVWDGPTLRSGPGSVKPHGFHALEGTPMGTRVRSVFEPQLGGLMKLMFPLMRGSMKKSRTADHEKLKQLLESG